MSGSLFSLGSHELSSGGRSGWKIDADFLTELDWECLAYLAHLRLPEFSEVEGVPRGGEAFAVQLRRFTSPGGELLIADDVLTTGASMERHRRGRKAIGVVAFVRGRCPSWITPLFVLSDQPTHPGTPMSGYE